MDSGLDGLSIMADALERMSETRIFQKVHFVFFNALFSSEGGYNSLKVEGENPNFRQRIEKLGEPLQPGFDTHRL